MAKISAHLGVFLIMCVMLTRPDMASDEPVGVWLHDTGSLRVRIAPCGAALCGTIVWLHEPRPDSFNPDEKKRSQPLLGTRIFTGMIATGKPGEWKGQSYNPDDGRSYTGVMRFEGDQLVTQGCVSGGLICRSVTWTRVN